MVFFFTSNVVSPPVQIYMGKDKYENEELITNGWMEDVWFHVDKLSSAHVYLRLEKGQTWDDIPEPVLTDLAQLTKANSIEGNKKSNITVIYTPWSNLKKTQGMETGQVTFHKNNLVKRVHVKERENGIINRLNKTKVERYPDLVEEKIQRDREERTAQREAEKKQKLSDLKREKMKQTEADLRSYSSVFKEDAMKSNRDIDPNLSDDDFM
ncbi:hypothetical protein DFS34DRAFT_641683 [Phlyctochytrium arcticum]|nr:hypothetical protein DFS34DRAFT_641683 [Phlyctochytrium arcticum]